MILNRITWFAWPHHTITIEERKMAIKGLLDFLKGPNINKGVEEFKETEGAMLIDVRTPDEYAARRIEGSKNVPLQNIGAIEEVAPDKNTPLFVYCYSGGRSSSATKALKQMGYNNVNNIGGISAYKG